MFTKLRKKWRDFKGLPAGRRFRMVHRQQADAPAWVKAVVIAGAVVALAVGILLTVLPGPAVVFYALSGALAAIESAWVARGLDRGEVAARHLIEKVSRRIAER